MTQKPKQ